MEPSQNNNKMAQMHPGVYIEEVPNGIYTITEVPTSVTAFIGRLRISPLQAESQNHIRIPVSHPF